MRLPGARTRHPSGKKNCLILLATLDEDLVSTYSAVTSVLGGMVNPGLRIVSENTPTQSTLSED